MTFTREEQIQAIYDLKVGYTLGHSDIAILKSMARQLLAGMEQDPVAYMYKDKLHTDPRFSLHTRFGNWSQEDINEYEITEIPLYAAPLAPVVPAQSVYHDAGCDSIRPRVVNGVFVPRDCDCRAAMLQGAEPVSQRDELPEGYALVPMKLTAENGAKGALLGEFSETKFINCPECFGDGDCETCDGSGRLKITVPVSWTTIKAIWAKGVEHFAAAPQQEADNG